LPVLERFVECFEEIVCFIERKHLENYEQLNNHIWITNLMFFTDLSIHMNDLNLNLQGFGKSIDVMFGYIKSFECKLQVFKRDISFNCFRYFPKLKNYLEKNDKLCGEDTITFYVDIINSLISQFNERFNQFRSLEYTLKFIEYPDSSNFKDLKLSEFTWLELEDFEMQLSDLKNSIWT
jgi:hypothetical protein